MRVPKTILAIAVVVLAAACGSKSQSPAPTAPTAPTPPPADPTLTAPTASSPSDDAQLDTKRPTLTVTNGTSTVTGTRTYEFQVSDRSDFSFSGESFSAIYTVAVTKAGVPEDSSGKTSFTPDEDLQPTTRYYWRARLTQGTKSSEWSASAKFKTRLEGFNRAGALYDPLIHGETVGTISGSTTWVPGTGLKFNTLLSYLRYKLPRVLTSGEFSMEVLGLHQGGPWGKPKIFQVMDGTGKPSNYPNMINAQYRGSPGNPDNCVAFKAVLGDFDHVVEPNMSTRQDSVRNLSPTRVYLWRGIWTPSSFRLVVYDGVNGPEIYNLSMSSSGGHFGPAEMYAFVGTNYEQYSSGTGTFVGMTVRNVWLSDAPRPASLGSAFQPW